MFGLFFCERLDGLLVYLDRRLICSFLLQMLLLLLVHRTECLLSFYQVSIALYHGLDLTRELHLIISDFLLQLDAHLLQLHDFGRFRAVLARNPVHVHAKLFHCGLDRFASLGTGVGFLRLEALVAV